MAFTLTAAAIMIVSHEVSVYTAWVTNNQLPRNCLAEAEMYRSESQNGIQRMTRDVQI